MNIHQLREAYKEKDFIPYVEFLKTDEWKQKSEEILKRDGYKCTSCGHRETIEHFDTKTKQTKHYWFDDDKWIVNQYGEEEPLVNAVIADRPYHLEIHHHIYVVNRLAWDYDDSELTTLCNWCHWDFHKNNELTVYSEDKLNELKYTPCKRCNGAGWFPEYRKIQGGICFRCGGARFEELLVRRK